MMNTKQAVCKAAAAGYKHKELVLACIIFIMYLTKGLRPVGMHRFSCQQWTIHLKCAFVHSLTNTVIHISRHHAFRYGHI